MAAEVSEAMTEEHLDQEIAHMQQRVAFLKKQLNLQATNLLAAESTRQLLQSSSGLLESNPVTGGDGRLLARRDAQEAHDQLNLYRTVAGITTFKVRDPDPNAVDGGKVLGLRLEVMARSRFLRPYYVMLNRPYPGSRHLRVHRHTVPHCIPLSGLAARHLPPPPEEAAAVPDPPTVADQDLARFARELRREIVRYHNRAGAVGGIAQAAAAAIASDDEDQEHAIVDVRSADAQAKHVELNWADGRTGRIVMDDDGRIEKMVVYRFDTRDHETKRGLLGDSQHIDDVVRLMSLRDQEDSPQG